MTDPEAPTDDLPDEKPPSHGDAKEDVEALEQHPVLHTTRTRLGGDTASEQEGEFFDAIRDIPLGDTDGPICVCGSEAEGGPHRAHCDDCNDEFVPELCPICGRRARLLAVDDHRMCHSCADKWGEL